MPGRALSGIPRPGPEVERVLSFIRDAGGRPMLAGGYVRDAIMRSGGRGSDVDEADIDVEVHDAASADALGAALARAGKVVETGTAPGVFRVRAGASDLEISLPRGRDFTINAILADPETGAVIDHHDGLADLAAGVLRHAAGDFIQDPLLVVRAVQLAARFGFRLAPATTVLCRGLADSAGDLPVERVWGEAEKIGTRGSHITAALAVLADSGWERCFPQIAALHEVRQDRRWHPEGNVHVHSGLAGDQAARLADMAGLTETNRLVIVMAALLHDVGKVTHTQYRGDRITSYGHAAAGAKPARAFLRSVGCPEGIIARIVPLVREHMSCTGRPSTPAIRRLLRRLCPATLFELALVCGADRAGRGDPDAPNPASAWLAKGSRVSVLERPAKGLLTGRHLISAGLAPGPEFKLLLAAALAAQLDGEFDDEAGALRWLAAREEAR
ncbi:MAG: HDIG domain-containing metalloprotein [Streptosporangiaceae bacterium]